MIRVGDNELIFYWKHVSRHSAKRNSLHVQIVHSGHAWLGFGVSTDGKMSGSTVVIGKPHHRHVKKYELTKKEWISARHLPDDHQTLQDARIYQNNTSTILTFKQTENTNDGILFDPNGKNLFLFAYGSDNHFVAVSKKFTLSLDTTHTKNEASVNKKTIAIDGKVASPGAVSDEQNNNENSSSLIIDRKQNTSNSTKTSAPTSVPKTGSTKKKWTARDFTFIIGIALVLIMVPLIACFYRREPIYDEDSSDAGSSAYEQEKRAFFD